MNLSLLSQLKLTLPLSLVFCCATFPIQAQKEVAVSTHAEGSFDVKMVPRSPDAQSDDSGVGRMTFDKQFHVFPLGIGVDVNQAVGQGTAAPNGHAQVVNRIGGEVDGRPVAFLEHPKHPRVESGLRLSDWLERSGRGGSGQEMAPAPIVAGWRLQRLGER